MNHTVLKYATLCFIIIAVLLFSIWKLTPSVEPCGEVGGPPTGFLEPQFQTANSSTSGLESDQVMKLEWLTPGSFLMGDKTGRQKDETQHRVTLTQGFMMGAYEVTQGQYQAIMGENPSRFIDIGLRGPVENVSWEQAVSFCKKLTRREKAAGRLPDGWVYALPTEAQWEYGYRAGRTTTYSSGDTPANLFEFAWYLDNANETPHPVGEKSANDWGLYDMQGNVWEWASDWYADRYPLGESINPAGPDEGIYRIIRGGGWRSSAQDCRASHRGIGRPDVELDDLGFRVVVVQREKETPKVERQGDELVFIKAGRIEMGSPTADAERKEGKTSHEVVITKDYYLGMYEVTQGLYEEMMGENPSQFKGNGKTAPVEGVSYDDAMRFCRKLTIRNRKLGKLPKGYVYTLPTEAQWEYGCRAGTSAVYSSGDSLADLDRVGWYFANSNMKPHPVGEKASNDWGIYDMHGNVSEWCADGYREYPQDNTDDATGSSEERLRVCRGGGWNSSAQSCRCGFRFGKHPDSRHFFLGFRVAAVR